MLVLMKGVSRIKIHLKRVSPPPLFSALIYSVAFGTFSGSTLPGDMEGDGSSVFKSV